MDKLSTKKAKANVPKRNTKPDNDELLAIFTRNLVDDLNRTTNTCMQEYKDLIKSRWNVRTSVYQFHIKAKTFKKPTASGKYTVMSTITEERSLENLTKDTTQSHSGSSKKRTTVSTNKPQQKTRFTETTHQAKEKKTEVSDVPQQRLKMKTQRPSEKTTTNKPFYITRRCK